MEKYSVFRPWETNSETLPSFESVEHSKLIGDVSSSSKVLKSSKVTKKDCRKNTHEWNSSIFRNFLNQEIHEWSWAYLNSLGSKLQSLSGNTAQFHAYNQIIPRFADFSTENKFTVDKTCSETTAVETSRGISHLNLSHCDDSKKIFSCKICDKSYSSLGALKMHIRTHTLPCKCHLCGKAFSRPWLLQGHIRTHTGEKPFVCSQCDRAFADRSNLRAHLQTHEDKKRFACHADGCGKTFSRSSLLDRHLCCSSISTISPKIQPVSNSE